MSDRVFTDSNVLIYAATGREDYPAKYRRANEIVRNENFCLSTQVVGEFFKNVQNKKKMAVPLTVAQACEWVERLFLFPLVEIDRKIVENAITIYKRYQLQYWDSVIISAAQRINADILYSEDMSHGQMYGSVRCINPFRTN